jgi:hypothetical protein
MNDDNFEQRLRNQSMRNVPADWRRQILRSATAAANMNQRGGFGRDVTFADTLKAWLTTILWPAPKAWAGLAAVWIAIFALNFSARDKTPMLAMQSPPPSRAYVELLKEQRRELAELAGLSVPADVDKPKPILPAPRSDRRDERALT